MAKRVVAQYLVPLIGSTFLEHRKRTVVPFLHLRPRTTTGAGWISDFVERRANFVLCDVCSGKYRENWWKRFEYISDWVGWLTNCDSCKEWTRCNMFYPEETIRRVLHPRFWQRRNEHAIRRFSFR